MISSLDQRILLYTAAGGVWSDKTIQLNDQGNGLTVSFSMLPGDFIYISSFLPFNHKYFKVTAAAAIVRAPKIEVNDLAQWFPVADQLDYTSNMKFSNVLQFTRDIDKTWGRAPQSKRDVPVFATAPTTVYDSYWTRISFPTDDVSPAAITFTLSYIGQCFSADADLFAEYPSLRNAGVMTAWQTGKTDWNDQHLLAAEYVAKTLRQKQLIRTNEQLLDIATLRPAAVHKTAQIIYSGLGAKNYESQIALAEKQFEKAMQMDQFQVDADQDGRKGIADRVQTVSRATR